MIISNSIRKYKDKYYFIKQNQPLYYNLFIVQGCSETSFVSTGPIEALTETDKVFPYQEFFVHQDGEYIVKICNLTDDLISETTFSHYLNLQKVFIKDIQSILCKKNCVNGFLDSIFGNQDSCFNNELKNTLKIQSVFNELLTYQFLTIPNITGSCSNECILSETIAKVIKLYLCRIRMDLCKQLTAQSINGKAVGSTELFKFYAGLYYLIFYLFEQKTAEDYEENEYINNKFSFTKIRNCIEKLGIDYEKVKLIFENTIFSCNTAPTVDNVTINVQHSYTFEAADFTNNFLDAEGDSPNNVILKNIPFHGTLLFNGITVVSSNFIFNITDVSKLVYYSNMLYHDILYFQISDNSENELYSNLAQINLLLDSNVNTPPVTGDNTIFVDAGETRILTLADFPYSDLEADQIGAIRIDSIANIEGQLQFNGNRVIVGDIFTALQIGSGGLTFYTILANDVDSMEFSVRASTGNQTWVS